MPKHNIYQRPTDGSPIAGRRIELQWQRDGSVALATTAWAGPADEIDTGREFLATGDGEPMRPAWAGEYIIIERDQVNHLIRQLRIARDQAFGRDE